MIMVDATVRCSACRLQISSFRAEWAGEVMRLILYWTTGVYTTIGVWVLLCYTMRNSSANPKGKGPDATATSPVSFVSSPVAADEPDSTARQ